jgi:anti-sigma B factor antagonist
MTLEKFRIEQQQSENANILLISGELDLSAATELRSVLETVVNQADKALILDFGRLKYIDSTGIGIIASVVKIRDEIKGPFHVRNIPAGIKKLFDLTGISGFLTERK